MTKNKLVGEVEAAAPCFAQGHSAARSDPRRPAAHFSVVQQVVSTSGARAAGGLGPSHAGSSRAGPASFHTGFSLLLPAGPPPNLYRCCHQRDWKANWQRPLSKKDNCFNAANSSFKPRGVLLPVATYGGCFLVDELFDGTPDGKESQDLEAADCQGSCG